MGVKKLFREVAVSLLIISLCGVSYAALSGLTATSGETLTSVKWNDLVAHGVPSGAIMPFNLATCPNGWSAADGTGGTPDLRGEFIRGLDNGRGVDTGRVLLSSQGDAIRNITGSVVLSNPNQSSDGAFQSEYFGAGDQNSWGVRSSLRTTFDASRVVPTASENRPRNVAFLYCIKD